MRIAQKIEMIAMGKSLVYSVGAWLAAIGIYLMVRFFGTSDTID